MRQPGGSPTTAMPPPCSSTAQRAIARPRPVPPSSAAAAGEALEDPVPLGHAGCRGRRRRPRAAAARRYRAAAPARTISAAGRAVPGGVVEQVGHDLVQPGRVGVGGQAGRRDVDADLRRGRHWAAHLVEERLRPRNSSRASGERATVELGTGRAVRPPAGPAARSGAARCASSPGRLGVTPSTTFSSTACKAAIGVRSSWRDVGDQLSAVAVGGRQVGRHLVEGGGELADLVAGGRPHPQVVVAAGHRPGGGGHLPQRRGHPVREHLGDEQRDDERGEEGLAGGASRMASRSTTLAIENERPTRSDDLGLNDRSGSSGRGSHVASPRHLQGVADAVHRADQIGAELACAAP